MAKVASKKENDKTVKSNKTTENKVETTKKPKAKYIDRSSMTVEELSLLDQKIEARQKRVARTIWDGRYAKMSGHRLLAHGGIRNAQWAQVIDWDKRG